ncbi:MAG: hypothetical protein E6J91_22290 [Deltaproteobacteria bacterium]|nr:MAG: hypothetical protein E6J91_22290 [Deltaproteobacteria bacterium]
MNVGVVPPFSHRPPKPRHSEWIAAGAISWLPSRLLYTAIVTLTIWTNCDAPTAPLVSGGTNAKPRTRRLSAALWPSKLITVVTPDSGPVSGDATGSARPLPSAGPVARGSRPSVSGPLVGARPVADS